MMRARKKKPTPAQYIFGEEGSAPSMCWFIKPLRHHRMMQIMQEAKVNVNAMVAQSGILDNRLGYLNQGVKLIS
jgi:hypothetical protein